MMFSAMRKRLHFSPATVIAGLALVFAMTGGAYAAKKYLITSTKQISPSVLKQLQGKTGANGAAGAQGAAGPQGPAGTAGAKGDIGSAGEKGVQGEKGLQGEKGVEGKKGATGTTGATGPTGVSGFTETLPSGKTETGTWSYRQEATTEKGITTVPISFPIPLAHAGVNKAGAKKAFFFSTEAVGEKEFGENQTTQAACVVGEPECVDSGCRWELENVEARPEATVPGTLCVFAQSGESLNLIEAASFRPPGEPLGSGYGPSGSYLNIRKKETSAPKAVSAFGTWAVTAP